MTEEKSKCCGVPYSLSVSTRWGRRNLCSRCGKDKDGRDDKYLTSFGIEHEEFGIKIKEILLADTEDMFGMSEDQMLIEARVEKVRDEFLIAGIVIGIIISFIWVHL